MEWLATTDAVKSDKLLGSLCCMSHDNQECILGRGVKACEGKVDDPMESLEYFSQLQLELTGDSMSRICGEYSSLENCRKRLPRLMEELTKIREGVKSGSMSPPKSKSAVLPILAVLTRSDF